MQPTNDYFTHYYVNSSRPEADNGCVPFNKATEAEKAEHFKWWNRAIDETLELWEKDYWQAYKQAEGPELVEVAAEREKIKSIVERIVKEGKKVNRLLRRIAIIF